MNSNGGGGGVDQIAYGEGIVGEGGVSSGTSVGISVNVGETGLEYATISGGSGESNTASNLSDFGAGPSNTNSPNDFGIDLANNTFGLFAGKMGVDLQFRSIHSGNGISIFASDVDYASLTITVNQPSLPVDVFNNGSGTVGQVLTVNGTSDGLIWTTPSGGGVTTFTGLTDVPSFYPGGSAGKIVNINPSSNGLEFGPRYKDGSQFTLSVQNSVDNTVYTTVNINWSKYGKWIFLRMDGFSGTFIGSPASGLNLVGSYPTEISAAIAQTILASSLFEGGVSSVYIPADLFWDGSQFILGKIDNSNFAAGLFNVKGASIVIETSTN